MPELEDDSQCQPGESRQEDQIALWPTTVFLPTCVEPDRVEGNELRICVDNAQEEGQDRKLRDEGWSTTGRFALYLLFGAVLGASPRAVALLIAARSVPSPTPEALDDPKYLFATCKQGGTFTNVSPDGLLYKTLIQSDHAFYGVGLTICYSSLLHIISPEIVWKARGWRCRLYLVLLLVCNAGQLGNLCYLLRKEIHVYGGRTTMLEALHAHPILDDFLYASIGAFCGSYLVLTTYEAVILSNSHETSRPIHRFCFNTCFCLITVACFIFLMIGSALFYDRGFLFDSLYLSLTSRALTGALRLLIINNINVASKRTVLCVNLLTVLVISTTAVSIRKRGFEYTNSNAINAVITSILITFSEVCSSAVLVSLNQWRIARELERVSYMTLDNVLDAYSLTQKHMYIFYGHFWSEESAGKHAKRV